MNLPYLSMWTGPEVDASVARSVETEARVAELEIKVGGNESGGGDPSSLDSRVSAIEDVLLVDPLANAKLMYVDGSVNLVLWDISLGQYCPVVLDNGVLSVGAPIPN